MLIFSPSQRGNILFLILLAVVLFAALAYAVTSSMRGGGKDVTSEQVQAQGAQIMQYASSIEQAIGRMRLVNNCADNQISFVNAVVTGYTNNNAPADKRCHVFDPAGGNISWQDPPSTAGTEPYLFNANAQVRWIGTDGCPAAAGEAAELLMYLPIKSRALCEQINATLGNPASRAVDHASGTTPQKFIGTYSCSNGFPDDGGNTTGYYGKASGCLDAFSIRYPATVGYEYFYYHVLIAR